MAVPAAHAKTVAAVSARISFFIFPLPRLNDDVKLFGTV
jgi:hypothetical protein